MHRPSAFTIRTVVAGWIAASAFQGHAADGPIGFASVAAYGLDGTTGGGDATPVVVRTALELQREVERRDLKDKKQRDSTPRVVMVEGEIDLGELANGRAGDVLKKVGIVYVRPHTTLLGRSTNATIRHGTVSVHGSWNVIIRSLRFRDLWEPDPTGEYDKLGWDYVQITNSGQQRSHHVWVDHCDFEKAYDGLLDVVHGSDLVTISWCRFAGDARGPQKNCILIGHSSSASAAARDRGYLNVTLHHNWSTNIGDRTPRARFGNIHAFNNLIEGAEYANISVAGAVTLVENCLYRDVKVATSFSHAKDVASKEKGGTLAIVGSRNENPRAAAAPARTDERFELENNFKPNVERAQLQFNAPADWSWTNRNALPYAYAADPVESVEGLVRYGAGPRSEAAVDAATMQRIYDEAKTPFKFGVVLPAPPGKKVDCPNVFRHGGRWYLVYVQLENDPPGYTTQLAASDDLLNWEPLGTILPRGAAGAWDQSNAGGGLALFDTAWGGSNGLLRHENRYWMTYLGGAKPGYETPPLQIGLASTEDPARLMAWTREPEPILRCDTPDARWFERDTLFKSHVFRDETRALGAPFVMFYNARAPKDSERIGTAVSDDLRQWRRHGQTFVIGHVRPPGLKHGTISGDPQIVRMGDVWVMFYFGAFWKPGAFDTFAASRDLVDWTEWTGPDLISSTEPYEKEFAHKPWLLKHDGVVYHFYCAVGDQGRVIALATSKDLGRSGGAGADSQGNR